MSIDVTAERHHIKHAIHVYIMQFQSITLSFPYFICSQFLLFTNIPAISTMHSLHFSYNMHTNSIIVYVHMNIRTPIWQHITYPTHCGMVRVVLLAMHVVPTLTNHGSISWVTSLKMIQKWGMPGLNVSWWRYFSRHVRTLHPVTMNMYTAILINLIYT